MSPAFRLVSCAALLLGVSFSARPASAQDIAAAEALFNRGLADMEAGHYDTGCAAIAESQRLDPRAGTLFTLATCEARWGHVATAMTRFGDYLALVDKLTPEQRERQGNRIVLARKQREKLAAEVPELTLSLAPGAPAGTVVERNGTVIAAAALGLPLPVDPGEYLVTTRAPGGERWEQHITLSRGEKKQVTLQVKAAAAGLAAPAATALVPAAPRAVEPPVKAGMSGQRIAVFASGGVGLAGLLLGGVAGGLALAKKGTVGEHCGAAVGSSDEHACDQTGLDAVNGTKTLGLVSTVGFAVGGAGVLAAAVLFFTEPRPARPAVGRQGRWISARVLSAGPQGVSVGLGGAW
jgi:hypothetical protein